MTTFASPADTEVPRDGYGRPLIIPPDGGKPIGYTRVSNFAKALDDLEGLMSWKQSQVAIGMASRRDLVDMAWACRDNKQKLKEVVKSAMAAAESDAAANKGTALHAITDQLDAGTLTLADVPEHLREDCAAYLQATSSLRIVMREQFVVIDDLQCAGSFDRLYLDAAARKLKVGDLKTGRTAAAYPQSIAVQIALYAHGQVYDPRTGERTPLTGMDLNEGILVHLPVGTAQCTLYGLDIAAGWEAAQLAWDVRSWRKRRIIAPWPAQ